MGDSHNIGIIQYGYGTSVPTGIIWLYAHSGFYTDNTNSFSVALAEALHAARNRWDDDSYFNRIIIENLNGIRGISLNDVTGDEHKRYVVDSVKQMVYLVDNDNWYSGHLKDMPAPIVSYSFENFVNKFLPKP